MATPFIGQIALFGFSFAPSGWALCQGQLMAISQNIQLFSIIGNNYGGDGKSTFALPDLRGRAAIGAGQGQGLSSYYPGESGGETAVALQIAEMPAHGHGFVASTDAASQASPQGNVLARATRQLSVNAEAADDAEPLAAPGPTSIEADFYSATPANAKTALAPASIQNAGGSQAHNNMQPYLALNFCIALYGIAPQRP